MLDGMKIAVLLIAHGSRHNEANADLHFCVEEMRRRGDFQLVEAAFLELARPTIEEGGASCVDQGADCVILLPYFLSDGVHVRRDLTDLRARLAAQYTGVDFVLGEPLGRHPLLLEVLSERARQAENEVKSQK